MALYLVNEMFAEIRMGGNLQLGLERRLVDTLDAWQASASKLKILRFLFGIEEDVQEGMKANKAYFVQQYLERFRNFIFSPRSNLNNK